MKTISSSPRRGEHSEEFAHSGSRPIGGAREFATFAVLMVCFAATLAVAFGRGHRAVNGARSQPPAAAHRAVAPNPKPQANPPIASGQNYANQDYTAWFATAAGNLGDSAVNTENVLIEAVVSLVWDPALGLSDRFVGLVADSVVNPLTGDRLIFNAAPGASRMAVAILAYAMIAVVIVSLASPIYASWKTWRLSRAHGFRDHSH